MSETEDKKEKNGIRSAARCRIKKKMEFAQLEKEIAELEKEQKEIEEQLCSGKAAGRRTDGKKQTSAVDKGRTRP